MRSVGALLPKLLAKIAAVLLGLNLCSTAAGAAERLPGGSFTAPSRAARGDVIHAEKGRLGRHLRIRLTSQ
jgi:hypothetical protein